MILRKDTFSTQDKSLQTKAIINELSLTPGNGITAKVELTPGNGIIPFCASKRCSSHMRDKLLSYWQTARNQYLGFS